MKTGVYIIPVRLKERIYDVWQGSDRTAPESIQFDAGRHARAKIGYVLLATEQTVQDDVIRLQPPGVGIHFTRAAIADSITNESLSAQAELLADCAASLLPDGSLDVVCYACTSGSLVIGEERVFAELNRGVAGAKATSLISGVIRALKTLQARRIVITCCVDDDQPGICRLCW